MRHPGGEFHTLSAAHSAERRSKTQLVSVRITRPETRARTRLFTVNIRNDGDSMSMDLRREATARGATVHGCLVARLCPLDACHDIEYL